MDTTMEAAQVVMEVEPNARLILERWGVGRPVPALWARAIEDARRWEQTTGRAYSPRLLASLYGQRLATALRESLPAGVLDAPPAVIPLRRAGPAPGLFSGAPNREAQ